MDIQFEYKPFISRLWTNISKVDYLILFACIVAAIITEQLYYSFGIGLLLIVCCLLLWVRDTKYLITQFNLTDKNLKIQVYKYDKILFDDKINLSKIHISKIVSRTSIRGISYKLKITITDTSFEQFEICGWTAKHFDEIILNVSSLHA